MIFCISLNFFSSPNRSPPLFHSNARVVHAKARLQLGALWHVLRISFMLLRPHSTCTTRYKKKKRPRNHDTHEIEEKRRMKYEACPRAIADKMNFHLKKKCAFGGCPPSCNIFTPPRIEWLYLNRIIDVFDISVLPSSRSFLVWLKDGFDLVKSSAPEITIKCI